MWAKEGLNIIQDTMMHIRFDDFSAEDVEYFKNLYTNSKDLFSRNQILQAFALQCLQYNLKAFF